MSDSQNLNIDELIQKFNESETVKALDRYFRQKSTMEILGVDRDENAHSNFLAWLFENEITGKEACIRLLKRIASDFVNYDDIDRIKVIREDFCHYEYKRNVNGVIKCDDLQDKEHEDNTEYKNIEGRTDIVVEILFNHSNAVHIIIENKVGSVENCKWEFIGKKIEDKIEHDLDKSLWQTSFYYDYYTALYGKEKTHFVFLSIPGEEKAKCKQFKNITYQDIMDYILVPLFDTISDVETRLRLWDYILALSINYNQNRIMAVSPKLKLLATSLCCSFKPLFDMFLSWQIESERQKLISFWNHTEQGIPIRDILRPFFKVMAIVEPEEWKLKEQTPDTTKYEIYDNTVNFACGGKNALFKWLVEKFIKKFDSVNKESLTLEHLQMIFPPSLHGKTASARNSKPANNHIISKGVVDKSHWCRSELNPDFSIIQTGWDGPEMMSRLIRYVKENIEELKDLNIQEVPVFLQDNKQKK